LEKYERKQKFANVPMMTILDGFQRVFGMDIGPINAARAAAFSAVQVFSPLKRQVISYATGESRFLRSSLFE
jgi:ubiquinone biosynthesis monooxygenase Coq6